MIVMFRPLSVFNVRMIVNPRPAFLDKQNDDQDQKKVGGPCSRFRDVAQHNSKHTLIFSLTQTHTNTDTTRVRERESEREKERRKHR